MALLFNNFNQIGNAIGWSLIHFMWQGALLFLGYWLVSRLIFKNNINLQYWLGIGFIALCLIIPIREFILQLELNTNNSDLILLASIQVNTSQYINSPLSLSDLFMALTQKLIPFLVILWGLAVFLISTHLAKSWFSLIKLSKETSIKIPEHLKQTLIKATNKLKLKFKPLVTISHKILIPATFGFFKPIILLPTSLIAQLPQEQMKAILLHELCHIKRADFLHNILQLLVETLFFYHPLVKWISRDVRKVREQCCDHLVLSLNTDPLVYAKALTNIASIYNNSQKPTSHLQIAANDGELFNRIKFLMLERKSNSPKTAFMTGLLILSIPLILVNNLFNVKKESTITATIQSPFPAQIQTNQHRDHYTLPNIHALISLQDNQLTNQYKQPQIIHQKSVTQQTSNLNLVNINLKSTLKPSIQYQPQYTVEPIEMKLINSNTKYTAINLDQLSRVKTSEVIVTKTNRILENTFPKPIKIVNPIYSRLARIRGISGTVILSFSINDKGRVRNINIDKNSPLKQLDISAKSALRQWRFDPKSMNKLNQTNRYQQIFSFNLDNLNQCRDSNIGSLLSIQQVCRNKIKSQ